MIQRVQSLYLILAAIVSGLLAFIFPFYIYNGEMVGIEQAFRADSLLLKAIASLFMLSALLALVSLFLFKNRNTQIVINRLNIILNFLLLGLIVYQLQTLSGETSVSEKGIGSFLPLIVVVLLSLATKAILKDERLVKSADRLR
jgi:branched-subunit amino acid transport protein AzlD